MNLLLLLNCFVKKWWLTCPRDTTRTLLPCGVRVDAVKSDGNDIHENHPHCSHTDVRQIDFIYVRVAAVKISAWQPHGRKLNLRGGDPCGCSVAKFTFKSFHGISVKSMWRQYSGDFTSILFDSSDLFSVSFRHPWKANRAK